MSQDVYDGQSEICRVYSCFLHSQILQYNQNLIFILLAPVIDLIFLSVPIILASSLLHVLILIF